MDNPWGEPSPPLAASSSAEPSSSSAAATDATRIDTDSYGETSTAKLSLELPADDDDAPAWDAHDSPDGELDEDAWATEARATNLKDRDEVSVLQEEQNESDKEAKKSRETEAQTVLSDNETHDDEVPHAGESALPPPAPPIPVVPSALADFDVESGQQMDDFPEDDDAEAAPTDAFAAGGDDFDDFGEAAEAGAPADDDDDFGDFGDFGDAAPLDEAAFEAPASSAPTDQQTPFPSASLSTSSFSQYTHPQQQQQQQPFASTSTATSHPPLRFDLTDPSRQAISSQLHEFWEGAIPNAARAVNDEPERQVEGVAQVLVLESSRSLWSELSTLPPLRPVDWRRSRIRREHLISMGFPVSQEEEAPLPSMTAQTSPHPGFSVPARPSSAPPPASSSSLSSPSQNGIGRPSTPLGTTTSSSSTHNISGRQPSSLSRSLGPAGLAPSPPPFDRERAEQALAIKEEDLSLRSLKELRELDAELDRISVEASGLLTHALMMREKETQDKEVYNGMIQDLVIAAAKMKTSSAVSAGAGKEPKRSGSGRWKLGK
ncbi:hypothetical protein JCM10908_005737 [Rhodotorula pacifica]|uniref:uncharacterized protein n=1 Tax=Rhodotorula pacifica TaxID=1495444 RepID=UPI00317D69BC